MHIEKIDWSLVISAFALIVSIFSVIFAAFNRRTLQEKRIQFEVLMRRRSALEAARASIIRDVTEIRAIMLMIRAAAEMKPADKEEAKRYVEQYAERHDKSLVTALEKFIDVREAYETFKHHLDAASRKALDRHLDEVSVSYEEVVGRARDDPAALVLTAEEFAGPFIWTQQVLRTVSENIEATE